MIQVKINNNLYPASVLGKVMDMEWDKRESKAITLEMDYETAMATFVDGLAWSILCDSEPFINDNGEEVVNTEEFDNSDFCVAGDITDHRDGTVTVKMGKFTELEEAYILILGGI